jgi:hypothetical protein
MIETAFKNTLHLSAREVSDFRALVAIPMGSNAGIKKRRVVQSYLFTLARATLDRCSLSLACLAHPGTNRDGSKAV